MAEHAFPQVVWLTPEQNPFGARMLDCRLFCHTMSMVPGDPEIARRFVESRRSTGAHLRKHSPANTQRIAYALRFPLPKDFPELCDIDDGPVFLAETLEDKWDIFLFDGWFYFTNSWTGELMFRVGVKFANNAMDVFSVEMNGAHADDPEFALRQVDFLIKSHLLRMEVPHPLPAGFPEDPSKIAIYSLNQYGRRAAFATYADTLPFGFYRRFDPDATLPI